jgi:hypothetical protein
MALGKTKATPLFAIALMVLAGSATWGPASAQVFWGDRPSGGWGRSDGWGSWGDRSSSDHYYRRTPYRDFFSPFSRERHNRLAPAEDYSKAPPPRKLETAPSRTVVVIGDSMADWLGYGLDESYTEQPDIGVERKIRAASGLVRYDAKNEALDWPQAAKDALSNEKPNAIVVMLGLNDRLPLREKAPPQPKRELQGENQSASQASQVKVAAPADVKAPSQTASQQPAPGVSYEFQTDQWEELYAKRIDAMIAALKSKGVPVIWVGLPAIRGTEATSDVSYLDELYRQRAEKAEIIYVDIWDGFVDEEGRYAMQGPDFEGQTRRLRTADGVYFTKAGAVKLASYVDHELRRVMPSHVEPVALPGPETAPKSESAGVRPDVGPVLPLTASDADKDRELLGAADHPTQTKSDAIAAKVLSRGETLAAPTGRADDFSWPRPESSASVSAGGSPEPLVTAPNMPEKQDTAVKGDGKNQADAERDAKEKSAIDSSGRPRVWPRHYYNYYSGRHYRYHGHQYGWYHR